MTEEFLHFVWQFGLFERKKIKALTGEEVDVISIGQYNSDAGPDFFNARIRINNIEWAGNVEIHLRSSDWNKHGHSKDEAYKNVVLHVVEEYDADIYTNNTIVPAIKLTYNKELLNTYLQLYGSPNNLACLRFLHDVNDRVFDLYLPSLAIERLEQKTNEIEEKLKVNGSNWEVVFYKSIAKNFGFRVNNLPFSMLAESIPITAFAKQKNNLLQVEALLFGQSGLLPKKAEHPYIKSLLAEYAFLKSKYNLKPIQKEVWKYLRVRPVNFPTIRIAQFAALIHHSSFLFSKIIEQKNIDSIISLFSVTASEYWNTHYSFDVPSPDEEKKLGKESIQTLIINTIVPFVFVYGKEKGKEELTERAIRFLETLPTENNRIIRLWLNANIKSKNAMESQALIQLYNCYCQYRKCLKCQIGTSIIKTTKQLI